MTIHPNKMLPASGLLQPDAGQPDRLIGDAKLALRRLASAVSVVTCRSGERNHAMTATSVTALSMAPPSMLVCVNRSAAFHAAIDQASLFAINILHRSHLTVSRACGGAATGEDRFQGGDWSSDGAAPVLADAQAAIVCRKDQAIRHATHTIFIGHVVSVALSGNVDPLIYLDGRYAASALDGLTAAETPVDTWYML